MATQSTLSLQQITGSDKDYHDVKPLYLNDQITQYLRDGKSWDESKIQRYISYFKDEDPMLTGFIEYKIIVDNLTVGIVGFRTDFSPDNDIYLGRPFISILVDPTYQGRGIGVISLKLAIVEYLKSFPKQTDIYSYIDNDNQASLRLHQSSKLSEGLSEDKAIKFYPFRTIKNHTLMVYSSSTASLLPYIFASTPTPKYTLINHVVDGIMNKQIHFPYSENYLPPLDVMVHNYQNSIPKTSNNFYRINERIYASDDKLFLPPQYISSNGSIEYYSIISDHYPDYNQYNGITDYFTESDRITAKKIYATDSTSECWNNKNCVTKIVTYLLDKYPGYGPRDLRDAVFSVSRDPGLFKLMWIRGTLLELFPSLQSPLQSVSDLNVKPRILDISSGWGDRLIAAILHDCDYLGFDPNQELATKYDLIIKTLNGDPNRHRVLIQPFEEADLTQEGEFDICLSSPPFFNVEIFSQEPNQSIIKFPDFNDWMVGFLLKSLKIAWNALKINGYLAIHMGDTKYHKINEPMLLFIEQYLPRSSYHGTIGLGGDGRTAPLWIWQKMGYHDKLIRWKQNLPSSTVRDRDSKNLDKSDIKSRLLSDKYPVIFNTYLQASSMGYLSKSNPVAFKEIYIGMASAYQEILESLSSHERETAEQLFRSKLLLIPVYLVSGKDGLSEWIIDTIKTSLSNIDNADIITITPSRR